MRGNRWNSRSFKSSSKGNYASSRSPLSCRIYRTCPDCHLPSFVRQYDEELSDLKKARRPGRPASTREDLLKVKISTLEKEYESGFRESCPDAVHPSCWCLWFCGSNAFVYAFVLLTDKLVTPELTTEENAQRLERWEGSWSYLTGLKWVRITSNGNVSQSSFPPRGS